MIWEVWKFEVSSYAPCSQDSPYISSVVSARGKSNNLSPLVQCTNHMCPIRVHWHVKLNYKDYWRVKVSITNFNYNMNYTQWNLVVQHPNFDNLTQIFSFNYKPLNPYQNISKLHYTFELVDPVFWIKAMTDLVFCLVLWQMTLQCYTVWSSTTTFSSMRGLMGTCSRSFCSRRTNRHSLSKRDGLSQEESTSTEITALCHHRRHTRSYQIPVFDKTSPSLCYSSLSS